MIPRKSRAEHQMAEVELAALTSGTVASFRS